MTETFIILYQFDRGGYMYSSKVNVHDDADIFVRFVLGLASDGQDLGFDPSIYWKDNKRWIDTVDDLGNPITCRIEGNKPSYFRNTIIGRASSCWKIKHKGVSYLAKDVWRSPDRPAEWEFLQVAKGCAGVVEMYSYETREVTIAQLRGLVGAYEDPDLKQKDRKWSRATVVCYSGRKLDDFDTGLELLEAALDITCGHKSLWDRCILHRDFSINNLLFGNRIGFHGVIIDLDMAIWTDRPEQPDDFRTGTRLFQSISVLRGYPQREETIEDARRRAHPHDPYDDLESLFLLLAWILFGLDAPKRLKSPRPDFLDRWDTHNIQAAADSKESFSLVPLRRYPMAPQFNPIFPVLLENLRQELVPVIIAKGCSASVNMRQKLLKDRHPDAAQFYDRFIGHISTAINAYSASQSTVPLGHIRPLMGPPDDGASSAVNTPFTSPLEDKEKRRAIPNIANLAGYGQRPALPIADHPFSEIFDDGPPPTSRKRTLEDDEEPNDTNQPATPTKPTKVRKEKEGTTASSTIATNLSREGSPRPSSSTPALE
ncbi:hypothetical protein BDN72DRAFT_897039 [Pluteus cervinus]|uniref:Uncharacterized protein n=1 Tax=Pluteus cervinus TaxID=181527 RepID=A0ACD3AVE3_9AGAR|nr:hypothetical protein BDN72DRAFT_897039 [Pluteus cervinus]